MAPSEEPVCTWVDKFQALFGQDETDLSTADQSRFAHGSKKQPQKKSQIEFYLEALTMDTPSDEIDRKLSKFFPELKYNFHLKEAQYAAKVRQARQVHEMLPSSPAPMMSNNMPVATEEVPVDVSTLKSGGMTWEQMEYRSEQFERDLTILQSGPGACEKNGLHKAVHNQQCGVSYQGNGVSDNVNRKSDNIGGESDNSNGEPSDTDGT